MNRLLRFVKNWTLPIAMITGAVFYRFIDMISWLSPYLIFLMLLLTFTKISPRKIRFSPLHYWLVGFQAIGSVAFYLALRNADEILAQSALICVLAPTATAAAVVTGMLGGSVASLTTYTIISNVMVAFLGPLLFTLVGPHSDLSFMGTLLRICYKVMPLLIMPLVVALLMQKYTPGFHKKLLNMHGAAFYLWAVALTIVTGKTVCFLADQKNPDIHREILIALTALAICILQFYLGRKIGKKYKKTITGGQGLGQKNTVLAIWMAQCFLNPVSSLGPASYVLWQNIINSWQLWKRRKVKEAEKTQG